MAQAQAQFSYENKTGVKPILVFEVFERGVLDEVLLDGRSLAHLHFWSGLRLRNAGSRGSCVGNSVFLSLLGRLFAVYCFRVFNFFHFQLL